MTANAEGLLTDDPSLDHLRSRLGLLDGRIRLLLELKQATDANPGDAFRGLYLTPEHLVAASEPLTLPFTALDVETEIFVADSSSTQWADEPIAPRLRRLAHAFDLDLLDTELLLVAVAPDLDRRYEQWYGYLHDDVSRRRASIGLALHLCGLDQMDHRARARLAATSPLISHGLAFVDEPERPSLTRPLRVPDRVASFLLGSDTPDAVLIDAIDSGIRHRAGAVTDADADPLARALSAGVRFIFVRDRGTTSGITSAAHAVDARGGRPLVVDLTRIDAAGDWRNAARVAVREGALSDSVLVCGPLAAIAGDARQFIELVASSAVAVILVGSAEWDPGWSTRPPLILEAPHLTRDTRASAWGHALTEHLDLVADGPMDLLFDATSAFRLTEPQIAAAVEAAALRARSEARYIEPNDLQAGARSQSGAGLSELARRLAPVANWPDLVAPRVVTSQLRELASRARNRERVFEEWRVGGRASRGTGVTALFAGESGTGKTLAAEVIARELGLDLYVIDLSTVVDKYIGETEKNLDRVFDQADRVNGVLLFDEADAIFGKRSEVRDARDRYANLEVAYLLQRMERFDGLAILTTNLRANLDDAFTRRIDVIVDFPMPDQDSRRALWQMHLPDRLPQLADIDIDFLARRFRVSGGNIRNICLTAAFLAAEAGDPVSMNDLIRGTEREYRKLGRLTPESEFGQYHALLMADATSDGVIQ